MRTSTAKATINKLKKIFSIEGSPEVIISDNAVFNSAEFQKFSSRMELLSISLVHPTTPNQMDKQNELYKPWSREWPDVEKMVVIGNKHSKN